MIIGSQTGQNSLCPGGHRQVCPLSASPRDHADSHPLNTPEPLDTCSLNSLRHVLLTGKGFGQGDFQGLLTHSQSPCFRTERLQKPQALLTLAPSHHLWPGNGDKRWIPLLHSPSLGSVGIPLSSGPAWSSVLRSPSGWIWDKTSGWFMA